MAEADQGRGVVGGSMSRFPIFVPVSLVTALSADRCHAKLKRRREKGFQKPFDDVVCSFRLGSFILVADSYWSWINSSTEPKFIGRVSDMGSGSLISGYLIPGFGWITGFLAAMIMTIYFGYVLVMRLVDTTSSPSSQIFALLFLNAIMATGWLILFRFWNYLVWNDPKIIKRLSKLLVAK
jgi:hypothetical protein